MRTYVGMSEHATSKHANLRWIRTELFGLQQDEFAVLLDLPRTRLSKYENGYHPVPLDVMDRIRTLAHARGVAFSADWFFAVPTPVAS